MNKNYKKLLGVKFRINGADKFFISIISYYVFRESKHVIKTLKLVSLHSLTLNKNYENSVAFSESSPEIGWTLIFIVCFKTFTFCQK